MSDPLVTCPTCGIPNFTHRGLKAHICKGPIANMKNVTPGKAESTAIATPPAQLFTRARELNQAAQLHGRMSVAMMIMCGVELARIKKDLGYTHGGDRTGARSHDGILLGTWDELCEQHVGISKSTAHRYTELAIVCGKKVKGLDALMTEDPAKFDDAKRAQIEKAVAKAIDGHTATEILREWGVAKLDPVKASLEARAAKEGDPHADIRGEDGEIDDDKLAKKDAVAMARNYWTETCKTLLVQGKNNKSWRHLSDDEIDAVRRTLTTVLKELT